MLFCFMSGQCIAGPVNGGRAFLIAFGEGDTFLAFPFKESESEYFITTCLSMKEVHAMESEFSTEAFNFHYDRPFTMPTERNWTPPKRMIACFKAWSNKVETKIGLRPSSEKNWYRVASFLKGSAEKRGRYRPGWVLQFVDNIPGPSVAEIEPGELKKSWTDAEYANLLPEFDWEKIFQERDEEARRTVPLFEGVGRMAAKPGSARV